MRSFILLLVALAACDPGPSYELYEADPAVTATVTVWVESHPNLPAEEVIVACEFWRPEGVRCALASDEVAADVRIRVIPDACEALENGQYPLARTRSGGEIGVFVSCMHRFAGDPVDPDWFDAVIAHELGHTFGLWGHVPESCDGVTNELCGYALMNPSVHPDLPGMTVIDHERFLARDKNDSVLPAALNN